MNRFVVGGCVGISIVSIVAGAVGLGIAIGLKDQSRIEYKIEKLKCELLNK